MNRGVFPSGPADESVARFLVAEQRANDAKVAADFARRSARVTSGEIAHREFQDEARGSAWTAPAVPGVPAAHETRRMTTDGHLFASLDDDGAHSWERDAETVSASDSDFDTLKLRASSYVWTCRNRAGEIVEAEAKAKADRGKAELEANTMNLALALASAGVRAFQPAKAPRFSIVDPISEQKIDLTPYRRVNFFPAVAKARRDPVVKHLEAYCATVRPRMATFTNGPRVWVRGRGEELRARVVWFHRRISELNRSELFRAHGAQMQFRGSEFGTIALACPWPREPGTEAGLPLVHLHAHVIYTLEHQLSPRRWRRFLSKVKNRWRFHWDESGALENIREACKYPIKPGDYAHLSNEHVASFFHATQGLHLVQPLGDFREIVAERRDAALKLVRLRNAKRELELRAKPDWNASANRQTRAERNARAAYRAQERRRGLSVFIKAARLLAGAQAARVAVCALGASAPALRAAGRSRAASAAAAFVASPKVAAALLSYAAHLESLAVSLLSFRPRPFDERRAAGVAEMKRNDRCARPPRPMVNRIFARLAPAPYFDQVTRPALHVANFNGDFAALRAESYVSEYVAAVRDQIARAERALPFLRVHTSHATGGDDLGLLATAEAWADPPGVAAGGISR